MRIAALRSPLAPRSLHKVLAQLRRGLVLISVRVTARWRRRLVDDLHTGLLGTARGCWLRLSLNFGWKVLWYEAAGSKNK